MAYGKTWTKKDIEVLREKWGVYPVESIANKLKRTETAVTLKAKRLGLGSAYTSEYLNANQVARLLGIDRHTVTDYWINKCNLKAKKKAMREFEMWLIDLEDLTKWLKKNQDKWDSRKLELYGLGQEPKWLEEKRERDADKPIRRFQKWTKQEDNKLIFWYETKTYKEIAELLQRSEKAIKRRISRLKEKGLLKKRTLIPWTDKETKMLIEMDKQGFTDEEIAWELGREKFHVTDHRRNLREQGMTQREIAERFDVHEVTVSRRLKRVAKEA